MIQKDHATLPHKDYAVTMLLRNPSKNRLVLPGGTCYDEV